MQPARKLAGLIPKGEDATVVLLEQLDGVAIIEKAGYFTSASDPRRILPAQELHHFIAMCGNTVPLGHRHFDEIFFAAGLHAGGPINHRAGPAVASKAGGK